MSWEKLREEIRTKVPPAKRDHALLATRVGAKIIDMMSRMDFTRRETEYILRSIYRSCKDTNDNFLAAGLGHTLRIRPSRLGSTLEPTKEQIKQVLDKAKKAPELDPGEKEFEWDED